MVRASAGTRPVRPERADPVYGERHADGGQYIWRVVKRVGRRAGVEASPHTLRRTWGSHALNQGVRLEVVSKQLGHSDVRVTQSAYAELEDETVRDEQMRHGIA